MLSHQISIPLYHAKTLYRSQRSRDIGFSAGTRGSYTRSVYLLLTRSGDNPVGAEYIIMEKLDGVPLGEMWYTMTPEEQYKVMKQVVELEAKLMALELPAFGSIYYQRDLPTERSVPLPDEAGTGFCIGPMAHWSWWNGGRGALDIDRGPCKYSRKRARRDASC